jgi:signal transduction histidine kinase
MLWFLLFSLPFTILFYFLGYFFTGKNLKPIQETISSLEDFGSNINHEIKTPLTEIVSTLGLARRTTTQSDEAIDQSLKSAGKITKILDSMQ